MAHDDAFLRRRDAFLRHVCAVLPRPNQNSLRIKRLFEYTRRRILTPKSQAVVLQCFLESPGFFRVTNAESCPAAPAPPGVGMDSHGSMEPPKKA
jgi:hypothetical protein